VCGNRKMNTCYRQNQNWRTFVVFILGDLIYFTDWVSLYCT